MVDRPTQFEITDSLGSTKCYSGTVGTSPVAIPAVAGFDIAEVKVECIKQSPVTRVLSVSYDNQDTWEDLPVGIVVSTLIRGGIKQVYLKGSSSGVQYKIVLQIEGQ